MLPYTMKPDQHNSQKTLAETSNEFYSDKKLKRTLWTGGGIYKEVEE